MKETSTKFACYIALVASVSFAATLLFYDWGLSMSPDQAVIFTGFAVAAIDLWVLASLIQARKNLSKTKKRGSK